jgi:hypothetical protein
MMWSCRNLATASRKLLSTKSARETEASSPLSERLYEALRLVVLAQELLHILRLSS